MQRIAVIDYGMGNLRSVAKAVEKVAPDDEVLVTADASKIASADRVVCPGQGAAADCMAALSNAQLIEPLKEAVASRPFLGICMGLEVLLSDSEENDGVQCLNLIPGTVKRFANPLIDANGVRLKVPHLGWSPVRQSQDHALWHKVANDARFYFAHSYYCIPDSDDVVVGICDYAHPIAVAVASGNCFACQFHPEKSASDGLQILRNFVSWQVDV